jgi:predicted dehydrogenase
MKNSKLRFAMVGCGDISHTHADAMKNVSEAEFTTCCDISEERAENWKKQYACSSAYSNLDNMLGKEKIDAVVLATWPKQHLEQIRTVVQAGIKNILCEKSMTISAEEALEVYELCRKEHVFILEACKYRYHPVFRKIESLIRSGEFGKIDAIRATFSNYEPDTAVDKDTANWRYKKECGGGVTYDWMSYLINAANYLSGSEPQKVFASGSISERFGVITRLYGLIEYKNGIIAQISSSKNASFSQELEVVCGKGRIISPVTWGVFGDVKIDCLRRKEPWPYILHDTYEIEHQDSFVLQLKSFIDVMMKRTQPVIPVEETVRNIYTIESLEKSLNEGHAVQMKC